MTDELFMDLCVQAGVLPAGNDPKQLPAVSRTRCWARRDVSRARAASYFSEQPTVRRHWRKLLSRLKPFGEWIQTLPQEDLDQIRRVCGNERVFYEAFRREVLGLAGLNDERETIQ